MNLFNLFAQRAALQPDHALVITATEEISYGTFLAQVKALGATLRTLGVGPGQCIGIHYPNSAAYIRLTYALWECGACAVPIPVELSAPEKVQIATSIRIDAVLTRPGTSDLEGIAAAECQTVSRDAALVRAKPFRNHPAGFADINAAFVRFSSGTTGTAKGVVLSHETIYDRIQAAKAGLNLGPDDRVVWLLSMAYHFAVTIVAYLSYGVTILLCPDPFGITIVRTAAKYRATVIYAAPIHYALMTQARGEQMMPDVRMAIVTTAALPPETAIGFHRRFGIPLMETYGIIEVGLPCINLTSPWEKRGSVGRVQAAYEIRLGNGEGIGEILLRGSGFVDAYYDPWRTRAEILADRQGWFNTGDLGEFDADGYLYIRGRSKEVISVGGMKVFPQEVEAVLRAHPAVQDACVFRFPHRRLGDVPHAHVVRDRAYAAFSEASLESELREFCRARLASHKIPECLLFVDRLTRTASGKLIRDYSKLEHSNIEQREVVNL